MNNMKKLLLIFLVLLSFASYGQRIQKANTYGLAFNRTGGDTLFYLPSDTFTVPAAYLTYPFMARKGANVYIWNTSSNVWQGLTGGTLDTTGAFVTNVYRRSDSVFYVKGGTHTFAFKDSTGSSTPTLQQVLTAEGNEAVITSSVDISPSTTGISFLMGNNGLWHDIIMQSSSQFNLLSNAISLSAGNNNILSIGADSIRISPYLGRLVIDTLNYTLSTTGKKILIRDTATGLVQNIDPALLGGGGPIALSALTAATADNNIDNGSYNQVWYWNALTGNGLSLASTSTARNNNSALLTIGSTGVNATSSRTVIGASINSSNSGTSSTNIGGYFTASNATNNYAIIVPASAGSVGIGTSAPAKILHTVGTVRHESLGTASADTGTFKPTGINSSGDIIPMTHWPGGGGTTSPAGSTKQIQYNNAGSFGGAAGFEYQSGSSPNVTITGQNAAHVPLYVKGIGSTQTADLFRVMRYDDSAMFRIAANGSVTLGPQYDYVNAHHAPEHVFKYSNSGYTGGIKLRNHNSGSEVRLHTVNNGLYLTDNGGSSAPMTLGTRTNPADASTFIAASGVWTISAGRFGVGGTADASAIIAATSTTKGFLPPKMTGTQAEAITSPAEGLLVYATDGSGSTITSKGWWGYDGAAWVKLN